MKPKRRRKTKKSTEFFCLHGHFREPYQVLLDGNFLHVALTSGEEDLHSRIGYLLSSNPRKPSKLYTTRCILKELQTLEFHDTRNWAAENCSLLHCSHFPPVAPSQCIPSTIESTLSQGCFMASQDSKLHAVLGTSLSNGLITFSVNGPQLLPPTAEQRQLAKEAVNKDMGVKPHEIKEVSHEGNEVEEVRAKPYSKLRQKQAKKLHTRTGLAVNQAREGGKKKRPGPRLRNALKAEAAAKALEAAGSGEAAQNLEAVEKSKKVSSRKVANEDAKEPLHAATKKSEVKKINSLRDSEQATPNVEKRRKRKKRPKGPKQTE